MAEMQVSFLLIARVRYGKIFNLLIMIIEALDNQPLDYWNSTVVPHSIGTL